MIKNTYFILQNIFTLLLIHGTIVYLHILFDRDFNYDNLFRR